MSSGRGVLEQRERKRDYIDWNKKKGRKTKHKLLVTVLQPVWLKSIFVFAGTCDFLRKWMEINGWRKRANPNLSFHHLTVESSSNGWRPTCDNIQGSVTPSVVYCWIKELTLLSKARICQQKAKNWRWQWRPDTYSTLWEIYVHINSTCPFTCLIHVGYILLYKPKSISSLCNKSVAFLTWRSPGTIFHSAPSLPSLALWSTALLALYPA